MDYNKQEARERVHTLTVIENARNLIRHALENNAWHGISTDDEDSCEEAETVLYDLDEILAKARP